MHPLDREAFNKLVDEVIESELSHPCAGRHATRWARIKEVDDQLKAINVANAHKKLSKHEVPYHETDEWKRLVHEGTLLEEVERTQAINSDWPIWQAGQHFRYLEDDNIREGEVITFDLDNNTIECTTWALHDFHGFINSKGSRQFQIIARQQIDDAERREEELELERKEEAERLQLSKDKERLPLFADELALISQ